ncbi:MAG: pyrroline-5-carboxylate reductase [Burkholderiales bacterium]
MMITFIGGGNMASALIGGLLRQGFNAQDVRVVEVSAEARDVIAKKFAVAVFGSAESALPNSDVIVLAVKPQQMAQVAKQISTHLTKPQLVISIAAGIHTDDLSRWLGGHKNIVRAMPNTPALVLAGMTGLFAMPGVSKEQKDSAQELLGAAGATLWFDDEKHLDAVTAISGSGPAYVFYFLEAVQQAGVELGLSKEAARSLGVCTFLGAAKLAAESADDAATLRQRVTSKGGTTERALSVMEAAEIKRHLVDAIKQACARSKELGDELGQST